MASPRCGTGKANTIAGVAVGVGVRRIEGVLRPGGARVLSGVAEEAVVEGAGRVGVPVGVGVLCCTTTVADVGKAVPGRARLPAQLLTKNRNARNQAFLTGHFNRCHGPPGLALRETTATNAATERALLARMDQCLTATGHLLVILQCEHRTHLRAHTAPRREKGRSRHDLHFLTARRGSLGKMKKRRSRTRRVYLVAGNGLFVKYRFSTLSFVIPGAFQISG